MQQPLSSSSSSSSSPSSLCKADNRGMDVSFHKGINYNMTKRYQSNDSFATPPRKYTTTTATTTTAVTSLQDPTTTASIVAATIVTPIPSISIATNNPKPFKETFTTITIPKKSTPDTVPTMRSNTSSNKLSNNNNNKSIINHNNNNDHNNDHSNYNCNKSDTAIVTKYPKYQTDVLMKWMIHNKSNTCPNQYAIQCLVHETGLTPSQVINWTTNVRKRNVKATCEGRKKPHHFIDFLFLAQERELKNTKNSNDNTKTNTKTNTINNKVKKNNNNNNNNNVVPTRLLKRKMIQSTKLQNNNHKCLKSLMVVEPTGCDFSSDKYVMNTNPTNGTTTTSTGGGVIYNNSPTRQYYDSNDDIDTYTPLSLNEPINETLLEEFVKSYSTTGTKVNWDIVPDYKVDSCWKQRQNTNDQTYYCYNNSNCNNNNNSIEYNPILSVVSSSSSTSNSISDTNYGTTTGTYKRRRLNTNNIVSPQCEPPTTTTMMTTMSTSTTTTNHPMVIDTPSDDIPVTLPPYQCTYSFDIIEEDVNNDMTTTDLRTWALELGIDSEFL